MGEPLADRRFKGIIVQGYSLEYEGVKVMIRRDPNFGLAQIKTTMKRTVGSLYVVPPCQRSRLFVITVTR